MTEDRIDLLVKNTLNSLGYDGKELVKGRPLEQIMGIMGYKFLEEYAFKNIKILIFGTVCLLTLSCFLVRAYVKVMGYIRIVFITSLTGPFYYIMGVARFLTSVYFIHTGYSKIANRLMKYKKE